MNIKRELLLIFSALATLLSAQPAQALLTMQLNLKQLTVLAERVFVGTCVEVKETRDEQRREVQYVTFQVEEVLKGEPATEIRFKQMANKGLGADLPQYSVGEEAVVFLAAAHPETGLSAPIGLIQGKFVIQSSGERGRQVVNGVGNRGLLVGLQKGSKVKRLSTGEGHGPLPFEGFVSLVKDLAK